MHVLTVDYETNNAPELFTQSLINTGFAVIKNHPIDFSLVEAAYQEWQNFFASEDKFKYLFDKENQDGYFPMSIAETAKGNTIRDIKEFYHVYPWGRHPGSMSAKTLQLYTELSSLAATLLQWIEANTPDHISQKFSMPLSKMIEDAPRTLLRVLNYPALQGDEEEGAIRAAAHEDINLITLLVAATTPGLQVKDTKGNWHDVVCDPGTIVVNTGDMLQMCSQGFYRSTTHRVLNPTGEEARKPRMSMPLFLHPRDEVRLSEVHTAQSYLFERLRELGVKN